MKSTRGSHLKLAAARWQLAVLALVLFLPSHVRGQGLPFLPEPITSRELMTYADRLDLSDQQRVAVFPLHDVYLQNFADLRNRDIQEYQDEIMAMVGNISLANLVIPPREELESLVNQIGELLDKIRRVDRRFFSELQSVLTEEQILDLDRVRNARERRMYQQFALEIGSEFNSGAGVDLTDFVDRLDFTADVEAQVAPIMRSYEVALLDKVRRLHREVEEGARIILDTIDELGLRTKTLEEIGEMGQDPEFQMSIMGIFDEASRPFQKATSDISRLNLATYRRVAGLLDPTRQEQLRDRYFQRVYREAIRGHKAAQEMFRQVLALEGLNSEQRSLVETERESYRLRQNPLIEEIASLLEESREFRTIADLEMEVDDQHGSRIDDLVERRTQITRSTRRTLEGILGSELVARLGDLPNDEELRRADWVAQRTTRVEEEAEASSNVVVDERIGAARRDRFLPPPIRIAALDEYMEILRIDEGQRSILDTLYDDYRLEYEALAMIPAEEVAEEVDDDTDEAARTLTRIKHRRDRFDALAAADGHFFEDLGLITPTEKQTMIISHLRNRRRGETLRFSAERLARRFGDADEAMIDLGTLVHDLDLGDPDAQAVLSHVQTYDIESLEALESMLDAASQSSRLQAVIRAMEEGDGSVDPERFQSRFQAYRRTIGAAQKDLESLNRRHLDAMGATLSAREESRLHRAFLRAAHPNIFDEDDSAESDIDAALAIDDLGPAQREAILIVATEFHAAYDAFSEQLVQIAEANKGFDGDFEFIPIDAINRELKAERIRFHREEAAHRARARLHLVLNDDQRRLFSESDLGG